MELKNAFIVIFDFHHIRSQYDPNDEYNYEYAVDYFDKSLWLKDKLWNLFPNKIIEISICTYVIKSTLNIDELKQKLIEVTSKLTLKTNEVHRQVFISPINELQFLAHQSKLLELEFIKNVQL